MNAATKRDDPLSTTAGVEERIVESGPRFIRGQRATARRFGHTLKKWLPLNDKKTHATNKGNEGTRGHHKSQRDLYDACFIVILCHEVCQVEMEA